ncbi:MAG: hypothetical protein R3A13_12820 [Bdellovibrionota bacterium]
MQVLHSSGFRLPADFYAQQNKFGLQSKMQLDSPKCSSLKYQIPVAELIADLDTQADIIHFHGQFTD